MRENQLSRYGAIAKALPFTPGKIFFVLNNNDTQFGDFQYKFPPDNSGVVRTYSDLASAYAATTSGQNDVIVIDSGATSNKLNAMLTVANNKVHFIGLDWLLGIHRGNNARSLVTFVAPGVATDVSAIKVTGTGCSFRGIKVANNATVAQNLSAMLDYGNNTYCEDCTFHNLGSAHLTNASAADLILAGGDSIYKNCEIGQDTLQRTVASGQSILISKGSSAQAATRCIFDHCFISHYSSQTTAVFVRVGAAGDIDRYVLFKNCSFLNFVTSSDGAQMAVAVYTPAGFTSGLILLENPFTYGATKIATSTDNADVYVMGPVGGANTSGIAVLATA